MNYFISCYTEKIDLSEISLIHDIFQSKKLNLQQWHESNSDISGNLVINKKIKNYMKKSKFNMIFFVNLAHFIPFFYEQLV